MKERNAVLCTDKLNTVAVRVRNHRFIETVPGHTRGAEQEPLACACAAILSTCALLPTLMATCAQPTNSGCEGALGRPGSVISSMVGPSSVVIK